MSFGFSIGDVIALSKISWQMYTKLHGAPGEIKAIGEDIGLLSTLLTSVDNSIYRLAALNSKDAEQLQDAVGKCKNVVEEVETLMMKYNKNRLNLYDKWKWAKEDVSAVHGRLRTALGTLTAFNATIAKCVHPIPQLTWLIMDSVVLCV